MPSLSLLSSVHASRVPFANNEKTRACCTVRGLQCPNAGTCRWQHVTAHLACCHIRPRRDRLLELGVQDLVGPASYSGYALYFVDPCISVVFRKISSWHIVGSHVLRVCDGARDERQEQ